MMRDLKEELFTIKGGDFPKWYESLTKLEKIEYNNILSQLGKSIKSNITFIPIFLHFIHYLYMILV